MSHTADRSSHCIIFLFAYVSSSVRLRLLVQCDLRCLSSCSEAECRRKWKMLRDQHRRERYRERERRESGVGLLNYRPWRYSAILSFLNPFIDARVAGTNGWALDPRPAQQTTQDAVGCSDEDNTYGEVSGWKHVQTKPVFQVL